MTGRLLAGLSLLSLALFVVAGDPFMAVSAVTCFSVLVVWMSATRTVRGPHVGLLVQPRAVPALFQSMPWSRPDGDCPVILTVIRR